MKKSLKIKVIILIIAFSIGIIVFINDYLQEKEIDKELNNRYYTNLEEYYPHEKLDKAFTELTNKLDDENFVNKYFDANIMNDMFDERFVSVLGGFLILSDHNLNVNDVSTLSEFTTNQNESVATFDFDEKGLPIITHYKGLYTDQITPVICFTYENLNNESFKYRYDLCFVMNKNHEWVFIDLNK